MHEKTKGTAGERAKLTEGKKADRGTIQKRDGAGEVMKQSAIFEGRRGGDGGRNSDLSLKGTNQDIMTIGPPLKQLPLQQRGSCQFRCSESGLRNTYLGNPLKKSEIELTAGVLKGEKKKIKNTKG